MTIENLEYIMDVLKYGSISAAASKRYMSQPLLSQRIRMIEQELGIVIFNRYSSPISLTYEGEVFLKYVKEIIKNKDNMCKEFQDIHDGVSGILRLGVSTHRALYILPELLADYQKEYPEVLVKVQDYSSTTFTDALLSSQVDLAMISHLGKRDELEYTFLHKDRMMIVSGPQTMIAQKHKCGDIIGSDEIQNEHLVSVHEKFGFRSSQDEIFKHLGVKPEIVLETSSIDLACRIAIASNLISLCPEAHPMETETFRRKGFYSYILEEEYSKNFSICYRKGLYLPKYMRVFIDMAVKIYHE